ELDGQEGQLGAGFARGAVAEVEDAANVGVGDAAREQRLAPEALHYRGPRGELRPDRLERHLGAEHEVLGLVDLAHPAGGDETAYSVAARQLRAGGEEGGRPRGAATQRRDGRA